MRLGESGVSRVDKQRRSGRGTALRLFLTVWLVYAMHATTNVVRETYLAISLGGHASVRVDEFLGLHPDLFQIPGRGVYINNNPGASILGGLAYVFVRPAIAMAVKLKPSIAAPKPPARYDDPRPNRTKFMNRARARGLDVVLGLATLGITALLMAPLGGLAAVIMYIALRSRLGSDRTALWWALAYAFATPVFFRSGFLNQNVILAHCVLGAWLALTGVDHGESRDAVEESSAMHSPRALYVAGLLVGIGLLCDYSALPFLIVFGTWVFSESWRSGSSAAAIRSSLTYLAGVLGPLLVLLAYQWAAFGNPLFPAQRYIPPTQYSVKGWLGFSLPTVELLWGNLFDGRYGLFVFCPLLLAAFAAPFIRDRREGPSNRELGWIFAAFAALYLFSSANQFANLQWNTGVRYMVPITPLLFLAAIPVLRRIPSALTAAIVLTSLVISLAVTMTREDVTTALAMVARDGPTLPVLIVLRKMESGYGAVHMPSYAIWILYAFVAAVLWIVWRGERTKTLQTA
jgi:hypothetical protein